jgi:hypothetical protein
VHGMDIMLWACGAVALASAVLALIFLPRRAGGPVPADSESGMPTDTSAEGPERAGLEV